MRPTREEYKDRTEDQALDIAEYIWYEAKITTASALIMAKKIYEKYISDPNSVESLDTVSE